MSASPPGGVKRMASAGRRPSLRGIALERRRLALAVAALAGALLFGTAGYAVIEGWPWFDALYMTVITLATIGYGETHALSHAGRAFTLVLVVLGLGVVTWFFSTLGRLLFEDWFGDVFWRSRVKREIERLEGHYVLCGSGRVGRRVRQELEDAGAAYLVIERDAEVAARLAEAGVLVLQGDATSEEVLRKARLAQAAGLVAALPDDADNLYVAMTARDLSPSIPIVARASDESVAPRLRKAGATRVISPNAIGGRQMAQALLMPEVLDFLQIATNRGDLTLQIEQVKVDAASEIVRRKLVVGEVPGRYQVSVVALRKRDGNVFDMPAGESPIDAGDTLIVVGRGGDCQRLLALAAGGG